MSGDDEQVSPAELSSGRVARRRGLDVPSGIARPCSPACTRTSQPISTRPRSAPAGAARSTSPRPRCGAPRSSATRPARARVPPGGLDVDHRRARRGRAAQRPRGRRPRAARGRRSGDRRGSRELRRPRRAPCSRAAGRPPTMPHGASTRRSPRRPRPLAVPARPSPPRLRPMAASTAPRFADYAPPSRVPPATPSTPSGARRGATRARRELRASGESQPAPRPRGPRPAHGAGAPDLPARRRRADQPRDRRPALLRTARSRPTSTASSPSSASPRATS